jgi:hypothetical protein
MVFPLHILDCASAKDGAHTFFASVEWLSWNPSAIKSTTVSSKLSEATVLVVSEVLVLVLNVSFPFKSASIMEEADS